MCTSVNFTAKYYYSGAHNGVEYDVFKRTRVYYNPAVCATPVPTFNLITSPVCTTGNNEHNNNTTELNSSQVHIILL